LARRIVWPALLSVIGTIPIFAFGALTLNVYLGLSNIEPHIFDNVIIIASGVGPPLLLLLFSLLLLLDGARQGDWGIVATISFAFPSGISVIAFAYLFMGQSLEGVQSYVLVLYLAGPLVGLAGAIWGLLWKSPKRLGSPADH
jgi:hypothetical protein